MPSAARAARALPMRQMPITLLEYEMIEKTGPETLVRVYHPGKKGDFAVRQRKTRPRWAEPGSAASRRPNPRERLKGSFHRPKPQVPGISDAETRARKFRIYRGLPREARPLKVAIIIDLGQAVKTTEARGNLQVPRLSSRFLPKGNRPHVGAIPRTHQMNLAPWCFVNFKH